ncbi:ABC transporter ATP-binding protein [Anaerococcus sp. AGMB09787]|uniref:ATP-binding cassette domain-containing protein n=1 Tax=Anaerococcus sp. AGMB09787 TaxID=2922869 RepID=UPI001FB0378F|nr:ABC transporter ATP-binding protein [Anaerococcus sp. AGMB09787]
MSKKILKLLTLKEKNLLAIAILLGSLSQVSISYSFSLLTNIFTENGDIVVFELVKIVLLILFALSFSGFNYIYIGLIREDICSEIRKKSFENIMYSKASNIAKKPKGYFYNEILAKVDTWKFRYLDSWINIITSALSLLWVFILIARIDIKINLFLMVFMLPLIINNVVFPKKMWESTKKNIQENSNLLEFMREYLESILIIKNNNSYQNSIRKVAKVVDKSKKAAKKDQFLSNLSAFFANAGVTISQVSSVLLSFIYFTRGNIDFGMFMTFVQLSVYIQEPVINIINSFIGISTVKEINENIEKVLDINIDNYKSKREIFRNIKIRNANYEYNIGEKVFKKDLNINFEDNKKYLIIGHSGSGKSTLVKILMKYNENYTGSIKYNNVELRELKDVDIEKQIMYVPQDRFIFNQSIRENVDPLGVHSDEDILKVINDVNLSYILDENGLDRIIDQDINSISGGEASRLYMAKILLSDKKIIILDEILSGLDNDNSRNIENLILNLEDKMVIHIAHNSSDEYKNRYYKKVELK